MRCITSVCQYFLLFLNISFLSGSPLQGRLEMNITHYLEQFGYLESNGSALTKSNEALIRFQEFYNLPTDGTLNQETLALISKPRCGVTDNATAYRVHTNKWSKTNLKWYSSLATNEMKELALERRRNLPNF
jgi:hypothetical protein